MFNVQITSKPISLCNYLTSYICIYSRSNWNLNFLKLNQITTKLAQLEVNKMSNSANTTHLV